MVDKGKAPAYPTESSAPTGDTKKAKPRTEYEEYLRRYGHPGWISVTSEDTEASEDSSSTTPSRSRTRSHSPHVVAPSYSPIPPIGNRGAHTITRPRKSARPGPSVSFRMPPPPPVRTPIPAPSPFEPHRRRPQKESWMPPRHSMYEGPSVLVGDRYSQSSRRASDVGPTDAALEELLKTVRRHKLTLQHATQTSQSAQFQAMMASHGVQRLEQEQRKKSSGWMAWLKKKWM